MFYFFSIIDIWQGTKYVLAEFLTLFYGKNSNTKLTKYSSHSRTCAVPQQCNEL